MQVHFIYISKRWLDAVNSFTTTLSLPLFEMWLVTLFQKLRRQPKTRISLTRSFILPKTLVSVRLTHGIIALCCHPGCQGVSQRSIGMCCFSHKNTRLLCLFNLFENGNEKKNPFNLSDALPVRPEFLIKFFAQITQFTPSRWMMDRKITHPFGDLSMGMFIHWLPLSIHTTLNFDGKEFFYFFFLGSRAIEAAEVSCCLFFRCRRRFFVFFRNEFCTILQLINGLVGTWSFLIAISSFVCFVSLITGWREKGMTWRRKSE